MSRELAKYIGKPPRMAHSDPLALQEYVTATKGQRFFMFIGKKPPPVPQKPKAQAAQGGIPRMVPLWAIVQAALIGNPQALALALAIARRWPCYAKGHLQPDPDNRTQSRPRPNRARTSTAP